MQIQITDRLSREEVHRQVETLKHANWRVRAILHAMVDAGTLPRLECQLPDCFLDSREFDVQKRGRGHNPRGLVIDHIVPQLQGGSDRPENLRAIHANCNVSRARGWKMSDEARAKISAAAKARGAGRNMVAKRPEGWNRRVTPDAVRQMRADYRTGKYLIREIAARHGVSYSTAHAVVTGRRWYANVED